MSEGPWRKPDWEARRNRGGGWYRTYAHGYWRPLIVVVLGRVLIGRRHFNRDGSWHKGGAR